jgi:hypothetical protein
MCTSFRDSCTMGLHTAHMTGGVTQIENVRVEKCGKRGIEQKYCLHLHFLRDCPTCLFKNNDIEFSQQRGLNIHGTHRSQPECSDEGCTLPVTSNGQGDTELNQCGIYLQSPTNILIGNRMANHFNGMFFFSSHGRRPAQDK